MWKLLRLAVLLLVPVCAHAQDAVFPVPAGVRTEGIPPIPMSIVDAASPYGQARQARLRVLAEDGQTELLTTGEVSLAPGEVWRLSAP